MFIAMLTDAPTAHISPTFQLAGTFTFKLITLGPRGVSDDFHDLQLCLLHLALWSLVASFLSGLLWFWLEVANMSGLPAMRAFSTTAWQMALFEANFGHILQVRLGLIVLAFALVALVLAQVQ